MGRYFDNLNETLKEYFKILSPEIPDFLEEYIETPEMQKQAGISVTCGIYYSRMFKDIKMWYSSLDHSVAVALIIWNFTKDKKQTLSGLFHDIATPVFKHSIDFMNGDYINQESTEDLTTEIIKNSKEIMSLLKRDNIKLEEVNDYHIYPIADNDSPMLSADRLEYTLSNGLGVQKELWNLEEIKSIYDNIEIQKNENNIEEIGFKDVDKAEQFVHSMSILSSSYITGKTKYSMQLLADVLKKMINNNIISMKDLYTKSEKEFIEIMEKYECNNISTIIKKWQNATQIEESDEMPEGKYWVSVDAKIRYINPLVKQGNDYVRINTISEKAKLDIEKALKFKTKKYLYLDLNF